MPDTGRLGLAVAAGRSGMYIKGPGYLHRIARPDYMTQEDMDLLRAANPGAFPGLWCCLGILADVAVRFGLQIDRTPVGDHEDFAGRTSYLSAEVAEWYGFTPDMENAYVNSAGVVSDLYLVNPAGVKIRASDWNDDDSSTFPEIFDGFERTFLEN